jgi:hypothetical protein
MAFAEVRGRVLWPRFAAALVRVRHRTAVVRATDGRIKWRKHAAAILAVDPHVAIEMRLEHVGLIARRLSGQ